MPLAFDSTSHGTVAFGFFNIETQMLLLQELFFFADDLCEAVVLLAEGTAEAPLPCWRVDDANRGDLHGAIAGQVLSGFIGATYKACPFPEAPEGFKQNPEGALSRQAVEEMIAPFGEALPVTVARDGAAYAVGPYRFDERGFTALVAYVDRGGYPRWRDERRPPRVARMVEAWAGRA